MARRYRAKKEKPPKVEPERLPLIEKAIHELIAEYKVGNLDNVKVAARSRAGKASGPPCGRIVKVSKVSAAVNAFLKDEDIGEIHYAVDVRTLEWEKLNPDQKKVELFHAICHMGGLDEKGRLFLVGHDVEEHQRVVDTFGGYSPSVLNFAKKGAKQLSLVPAK